MNFRLIRPQFLPIFASLAALGWVGEQHAVRGAGGHVRHLSFREEECERHVGEAPHGGDEDAIHVLFQLERLGKELPHGVQAGQLAEVPPRRHESITL